MNAPHAIDCTDPVAAVPAGSPFCLQDDAAWKAWRAARLAAVPRDPADLVVPVADPRRLDTFERAALRQRLRRFDMAVYDAPALAGLEDTAVARRAAAQLGLSQLDTNWLADEDGISRITVSDARDDDGSGTRGGFIPYTDRPIRWHTDGYYHPATRTIRSMVLHCVRPARDGGINALVDHELAYVALRDADPRWIAALMAPDAMVIPAREDGDGVARAAQAGPVFSVDPADGSLHMRYTARTRSIEWKQDTATREAVAFLAEWLAGTPPGLLQLRMEGGMGLVAHNVLHDRSAFVDDPAAPRLLYRARYRDRLPPASLDELWARPDAAEAADGRPDPAPTATMTEAP